MAERRKSKKKKARWVMPPEEVAALKAKRKLGSRFFIIVVTSLVFFIWGAFLSEPSIIPNYVTWLTMLGGGFLMPFLFRRSENLSRSDWTASLFIYAIFGLSSGFFSFIAINYYGPHKPAETVQLPILKRGIIDPRSGPDYPYCIVSHEGIKTRIKFDAKYLDLAPKASMVELQIEKGILGYYITVDQQLIP